MPFALRLLRLEFEADSDGDYIAGRIRHFDGRVVPFMGWLELIVAIEALSRRRPGPRWGKPAHAHVREPSVGPPVFGLASATQDAAGHAKPASARITELPRRLEPVTRDPFIDGPDARSSTEDCPRRRATRASPTPDHPCAIATA